MSGKYLYVDAEPARLHIATLHGHHWSSRAISAATDGFVSYTAVTKLARGDRARVRECTAAAILAVDPLVVPESTVRGINPMVSKVGSIRRIQALQRIGYSHAFMTDYLGFQTGKFCHQTRAGLCLASTHRAIAAMYRELAQRPGPSESARRWAIKHGYASPAAWEDIDRDEAPDLTPEPTWSEDSVDDVIVERILDRAPRPRKPTHAECAEACRRLIARGVSTYAIEHDYGLVASRYTEQAVA